MLLASLDGLLGLEVLLEPRMVSNEFEGPALVGFLVVSVAAVVEVSCTS